MGRRLTTYVHVDGRAWGPSDEVPAEVAERITNPDVWDTAVEDGGDAEASKPAPKRRTAAKKD